MTYPCLIAIQVLRQDRNQLKENGEICTNGTILRRLGKRSYSVLSESFFRTMMLVRYLSRLQFTRCATHAHEPL